jgi:hypothetical protein
MRLVKPFLYLDLSNLNAVHALHDFVKQFVTANTRRDLCLQSRVQFAHTSANTDQSNNQGNNKRHRTSNVVTGQHNASDQW